MALDRRIIYLFVLLALSIPLFFHYTVPPAKMESAQKLFHLVDNLEVKPGEIAFLAFDFGPGTSAENGTQAEVVVEHLMRKGVPFALFSLYPLAEAFLNSIPENVAARLQREMPERRWEYGTAWVNLGYRPGAGLLVQAIPKSENIVELFKRDVRGNELNELPAFRDVKTLEQIRLLVEFTGLTGTFAVYNQFFQKKGYRPLFGHGCTSITIPEAFIFLDSGQINGLLEGVAGAAWYSNLLQQKFPARPKDNSQIMNTGLGVAHLVIILLILTGNLVGVWRYRHG